MPDMATCLMNVVKIDSGARVYNSTFVVGQRQFKMGRLQQKCYCTIDIIAFSYIRFAGDANASFAIHSKKINSYRQIRYAH